MFDVSERSEYVQTMITNCIDQYSKQRQQAVAPDTRLENMVNRMFHKVLHLPIPIRSFYLKSSSQCLDSKNFRQVIGIAIECRRFDIIETAIRSSSNVHDTLSYCMHVSEQFYRAEIWSS